MNSSVIPIPAKIFHHTELQVTYLKTSANTRWDVVDCLNNLENVKARASDVKFYGYPSES